MNPPLNQNQLIYSLDTSSLIAAFHEWYPIKNFPVLWHKIEELIKDGRLKMLEAVFKEAMRDLEIEEWCDQRELEQYLQLEVDDAVETEFDEVQLRFPRLVNTRTGKSAADPWVIALAMATPNCVVVTQESHGSKRKPKIPDVCDHFEVEYIRMVDLIKRENWIF